MTLDRARGTLPHSRRRELLERYMRESRVFPLYDAGDRGMQVRKIWGVMLDDSFDPRAFAQSDPIVFTKDMEGAGLGVDQPMIRRFCLIHLKNSSTCQRFCKSGDCFGGQLKIVCQKYSRLFVSGS
jgi:hypothetical protein